MSLWKDTLPNHHIARSMVVEAEEMVEVEVVMEVEVVTVVVEVVVVVEEVVVVVEVCMEVVVMAGAAAKKKERSGMMASSICHIFLALALSLVQDRYILLTPMKFPRSSWQSNTPHCWNSRPIR